MWPHSHNEGPCSVSPEGIMNWHGCSLGAVGGIPLESDAFNERHVQLQRFCGFLGVNQEFLTIIVWSGTLKEAWGLLCKNPPAAQVKVLPMASRPYETCPSLPLSSDLLDLAPSLCDSHIGLLTVFTHTTLSSTPQFFHWPLSPSGVLFSQIGISCRLLLKCHNLRKNFPDNSF